MKTINTLTILIFILSFQYSSSQCWKEIAAGASHSVAIKSDGTLWAWGRNHKGQLGDGTTVDKNVPTQIGTDTDWSIINASSDNTTAIKTDGSLWIWGENSRGQVGDGNFGPGIFNPTPTRIGNDNNWVKITSSTNQSFAIKDNGTLWGWGQGQYMGNGDLVDRYTPFQIGTSTDWLDISSSCCNRIALKTDGTLWGWGVNDNGSLGLGAITTSVSLPTQIGNDTNDWTKISIGSDGNATSTCLVKKNNGNLLGMGMNSFGTVGIGSSNSVVSIPTQIGSDTEWNYIKTGGGSSFGISVTGELFGWGLNIVGELGDGTLINKNAPVSVGNLVLWKKIVISNAHTLALTIDNSLYTWGWNLYGQLGDGTFINKSVPTSIGNSCVLSTSAFETFESMQIFPNPVQSSAFINFNSNRSEIVSISITNNLGQLILDSEFISTIGSNQQNINLSSYRAGIYFVTLKNQNKRNCIKLIKN